MFLVTAAGQTLGTIGGGCVEAEVRTRAVRAIDSPGTTLHEFKLDHDFGWDDGLVCGGTMSVCIHVVTPSTAAPIIDAATQLALGNKAELHFHVCDAAGTDRRFRIPLTPLPRLLIAGAGHVGLALARLAGTLDFRVTLIDDREPTAETSIDNCTRVVADIPTELRRQHIDGDTAVVIVTRGHKHDADALHAAVGRGAVYVGLIGSRRKIKTIYDLLHQAGVGQDALQAVHAPIGLDIGAVSPAEIAVAIAAELIAVRRGHVARMPCMSANPAEVARWLAQPARPEPTGPTPCCGSKTDN